RVRSRVRRALVAVAAAGLIAAGVLGWQRLTHQRLVAGCEEAGDEVEQGWSPADRERVRTALIGSGLSYAEETAARVIPWLDDKASAWRRARTGVCLDVTVDGRWSPDLEERGLFCLDERLLELDALATELA